MEQQKIQYHEIMALGFTEEFHNDTVYFNQYGYQWAIIEKQLTSKIFLNWEKESQLCEMIRINNKRDCSIMARMPIKDLAHLNEIIDFFIDK